MQKLHAFLSLPIYHPPKLGRRGSLLIEKFLRKRFKKQTPSLYSLGLKTHFMKKKMGKKT
jgi:hypothetical protein